MPELAPIVLFVYNRPWHTRQCLESLSKNELAGQSALFIYADGPKANATEEQLQRIEEVRKIAREKNWCGNVEIIERKENFGLAKSITSAVTEIVNQFGKIIVLEDDLQLSPGFLKYMNSALEVYLNDEKVMHISGYMYPVKSDNLPETIFMTLATCWGWSTWKRAWNHYDASPENLLSKIKPNEIKKFDLGFPHYEVLKACIGRPDFSWAVRWHASVFVNKGLCLHPNISLVENIGHDGSGMNCSESDLFSNPAMVHHIGVKREKIEVNEIAEKRAYRFQKAIYSKSFKQQLKEKMVNMFPLIARAYKKLFSKSRKKAPVKKFEDWSNHVPLLNVWGRESVWDEIKMLLVNCQGKVLDIGCGTGEVIKLLSGIPGIEMYGSDISEKLLTECVTKGIAGDRLKVCDLKKLDQFGENAFDYSFSIAVLHYINKNDLVVFARNASLISKKASFHFVSVSKINQDEGWISNWHSFQNNSVEWWKSIFETAFRKVTVMDSSWDDKDSFGKWIICVK
jgi:SAM-dependent methyltransferase